MQHNGTRRPHAVVAERELIRGYHEGGNPAALEELVERYLPLVHQCARRYRHTKEPLEDLVQVGCEGLLKALERFDSDRGTAFTTYAVPTILGELKRYFRDTAWAVHVPRGMQERAMRVDKAVEQLRKDLGRAPTVSEIAATVAITSEDVLEAMEAASGYEAVSLDSPSSRNGEEEGPALSYRIGTEEETYDLVEYESALAPALRALPPRDRLVLRLRYVEDRTQANIADQLGVSQMHVSRLIRRALGRLRALVGPA